MTGTMTSPHGEPYEFRIYGLNNKGELDSLLRFS